jgi:hypothetical protein
MKLAVCIVFMSFAAAAFGQAVYPDAEAAAQALTHAVQTHDKPALKAVLGADYARFIPADSIGEQDVQAYLQAWDKGHRIVEDAGSGGARAHVEAGGSGWTLPIPLVREARGWRFDPPAARDELLTRRIGRNERSAMLAALAYLDAQRDYHQGAGAYAQRLVSTPGRHDGLFWPTQPGAAQSPLGPLAATMPNHTLPADAYHGYHYKILESQGPHAKGGARRYVARGRMTRGFALAAWPAQYGATGVMSFIVNQDGQIYEKNLGAQTAQAGAALAAFDPDPSWRPVSP